jgi:hypothetical protein
MEFPALEHNLKSSRLHIGAARGGPYAISGCHTKSRARIAATGVLGLVAARAHHQTVGLANLMQFELLPRPACFTAVLGAQQRGGAKDRTEFSAHVTPNWPLCRPEGATLHLARACCRASSAGRVGAWGSFDYFVGRDLQRLRYSKAHGTSRLSIYDQL